MPIRAVYDCNVFFQALIFPKGPAGLCVNAAVDRRVTLFTCEAIVEEFVAVSLRPALARRFAITQERLNSFLSKIEPEAIRVESFQRGFQLERDPDDALYVDSAIATQAEVLVTRDKDLLSLADVSNKESEGLKRAAPSLQIVSPSELLSRLGTE